MAYPFFFALLEYLHNIIKEVQVLLLIVVEQNVMTKLIELKESVVFQNHWPQLSNKLYSIDETSPRRILIPLGTNLILPDLGISGCYYHWVTDRCSILVSEKGAVCKVLTWTFLQASFLLGGSNTYCFYV